MVRFDDVLRLRRDGSVEAQGPLDPASEKMVELCAWVFQRGDDDAAVTEMSTTGGELEFPPGPPPKWRMVLGKVGKDKAGLEPGDAFAVAVALLQNRDGEQRVVWWGHPVTLVRDAAAA